MYDAGKKKDYYDANINYVGKQQDLALDEAQQKLEERLAKNAKKANNQNQ